MPRPITAIDRLADIRRTFARACEHEKAWSDLLDEWAEVGEKRYDVRGRQNPLTGWLDLCLAMPEPPPQRAAVIYADVVRNLRATLDHLVCHLVELNGGDCATRDVGFPCVQKAQDWPSAVGQRLRGFPTQWRYQIKAAQPFEYGTDFNKHPMYILHQLDIEGKHRMAVHFGVCGIDLNFVPIFNRPRLLGDDYVLHSAIDNHVEINDGDVIARLQPISTKGDLIVVGVQGTHGPMALGPLSNLTKNIGESMPNLTCFVGSVIDSLTPAFV